MAKAKKLKKNKKVDPALLAEIIKSRTAQKPPMGGPPPGAAPVGPRPGAGMPMTPPPPGTPPPGMKPPMASPPSFKKGGEVKKTGMALVHKGEKVLTKAQQKKKGC